jgi:crossover junction endodeoxyribonuclease RuvC
MLPQLDATDGLAAADCKFLKLGRPTSEKAYSGWKDFIAKNEEKVKSSTSKKK